MPHFPTHPPFLFSLTKKHGDFVDAIRNEFCRRQFVNERPHRYPHRRAQPLLLQRQSLFNGHEVVDAQSWTGGVTDTFRFHRLNRSCDARYCSISQRLLQVPALAPDYDYYARATWKPADVSNRTRRHSCLPSHRLGTVLARLQSAISLQVRKPRPSARRCSVADRARNLRGRVGHRRVRILAQPCDACPCPHARRIRRSPHRKSLSRGTRAAIILPSSY